MCLHVTAVRYTAFTQQVGCSSRARWQGPGRDNGLCIYLSVCSCPGNMTNSRFTPSLNMPLMFRSFWRWQLHDSLEHSGKESMPTSNNTWSELSENTIMLGFLCRWFPQQGFCTIIRLKNSTQEFFAQCPMMMSSKRQSEGKREVWETNNHST